MITKCSSLKDRRSGSVAAALAGVLLMFGALACTAAPGDIDPTYGTLGRSAAPLGYEITAIVPLPDDRLIVVSAIPSDCCPVGTTIQRLDRNGTPDNSFGNGGASGVVVGAQAYGAALRSNGGLLLRGQFEIGGGFVAALTADGRHDPIFAGEYIRRIDSPVTAVASQPDGSTIYAAAGPGVISETGLGLCSSDGWTLHRVTPAGQSDSTFGTNGTAKSREVDGTANLSCLVQGLWVDADGRIIVWGSTLRRLSANGSIDDSFGQSPHEPLPPGSVVTRLQDGSFLIARPLRSGQATTGGTVVSRLDRNGRIDSSFGADGSGSVTLPDGTWYPLDIAAQLDGTFFYVALRSASPSRAGTVVVRLKANGQMDRSFGQDGAALVSHSTGILADIAAQKTGSLVVASYKDVYRLHADDSQSPGAISIKTISAPVGSSVAQVVLGRTAGLGTAIAVEYRTVDNGAIAGRDYVASTGRLDWAAGDASDKTIAIEILQRPSPTAGSLKSFFLQLAPASGGPVMLDQEAAIWIEPSQPASPSPTPPPATTPPAPGSTSGQHSGGGGGGSSGPALLGLLALMTICARRRKVQLSLAAQH